jgi:hypothetical protein
VNRTRPLNTPTEQHCAVHFQTDPIPTLSRRR